jgi:hypothetical protein
MPEQTKPITGANEVPSSPMPTSVEPRGPDAPLAPSSGLPDTLSTTQVLEQNKKHWPNPGVVETPPYSPGYPTSGGTPPADKRSKG